MTQNEERALKLAEHMAQRYTKLNDPSYVGEVDECLDSILRVVIRPLESAHAEDIKRICDGIDLAGSLYEQALRAVREQNELGDLKEKLYRAEEKLRVAEEALDVIANPRRGTLEETWDVEEIGNRAREALSQIAKIEETRGGKTG